MTVVVPDRLMMNAWAGDDRRGVSGELTIAMHSPAMIWASHREREPVKILAADDPALPGDWRDPRVGWGVVLPHRPDVDPSSTHDVPELAPLMKDRPGAPVFRCDPTALDYLSHLLRYDANGIPRKPPIAGTGPGIANDKIPAYLLIVATPTEIPWELQYALATRGAVGRLPLTGEPLANYVEHLVSGWAGAAADRSRTLVWAVDWGSEDITRLMREAIAKPVHDRYANDSEAEVRAGATYLDGSRVQNDATCAALIDRVASSKPWLVVTSSHGATLTKDPEQLRRTLGVPVDQDRELLDPEALVEAWEPDGTIWYAHACCGAGSSDASQFTKVVSGDEAQELLEGVAALGDTVAPLPLRLLSAAKPARAFIGHVEPTFDWTIREPESQRLLTDSVLKMLYDALFQKTPPPLGLAMTPWYAAIGPLLWQWDQAYEELQDGKVPKRLLAARLGARDRASQVLLGDPTVTPP